MIFVCPYSMLKFGESTEIMKYSRLLRILSLSFSLTMLSLSNLPVYSMSLFGISGMRETREALYRNIYTKLRD